MSRQYLCTQGEENLIMCHACERKTWSCVMWKEDLIMCHVKGRSDHVPIMWEKDLIMCHACVLRRTIRMTVEFSHLTLLASFWGSPCGWTPSWCHMKWRLELVVWMMSGGHMGWDLLYSLLSPTPYIRIIFTWRPPPHSPDVIHMINDSICVKNKFVGGSELTIVRMQKYAKSCCHKTTWAGQLFWWSQSTYFWDRSL